LTLVGQFDVPYQLAGSTTGYVLGDPVSQRLYTFDTNGVLTAIADGHGNTHTLNYAADRLVSVTDGLGRTLSFQYDGGGLLTNVRDGTRAIGFTQAAGLLTGVTDALGNQTSYQYDLTDPAAGLLTATVQPEGNVPFAQTYNTNAQVVVQIEAGVIAGTNLFAYNAGTTTLTDALGYQTVQANSADGRLTNHLDEAGQATVLGYNSAGQRTARTDRLGHTELLAYDSPSGKLASLTNADGIVTRLQYTNRAASGVTFYDLAQTAYPDGTFRGFTYDASGNPLTRTDRAGRLWSYSYNARGQVLTATNPVGGITVNTYNSDGTLASRSDSDTGITSFSYDSLRRLTNVVNPDGSRFGMAYDAGDRVIATTDELGQTYHYAYDRNNNLRQVTDPTGQVTSFLYDARNRLQQVTDRVGAVTRLGYDARGYVVSRTLPTGDLIRYTYDARRRLIATTDGEGNVWTNSYDHEARLVSAADPLNHVGTIQRNVLGNRTNVLDALGNGTAYAYDTMERVTAVLDPLTRASNYGYDAHGLLATAGQEALGTATYQRSPLGRLAGILDLNGNGWSFTYTPMGRLQSVTDPLQRSSALTYDGRGRPLTMTFADGSGASNRYDPAGNLTARQYSAGPGLVFGYDALHRLTNAADLALAYDAEGRITNTVSSGVNFEAAYDLNGRLVTATYNNGAITIHYAYDRRGLLTNVTDSLGGGLVKLSYDAAGRLAGQKRGNGVAGAYAYDAAGRLTRIQEGTFLDLQFTLDAAGQIVSTAFTAPLDPGSVLGTSLQNLRYDAAHQLASPGYAYDARGRQVASPAHAFAWDGASRLTGIDQVTLGYNGLGQVETRAVGGTTERYFYNRALGLSPIVMERNEMTGAVERYYVWSPAGRLLYLIDATHGNTVTYFHFDQVGSTLALTAADGTVSDAYAYSPYGVLLGHTGASSQPFTFNGRFGVRSEPAGSLYHMRARYYDPATARFLSPDPLWPRTAQPGSLDPYDFALRNPTRKHDSSGLLEQDRQDMEDVIYGGGPLGLILYSFIAPYQLVDIIPVNYEGKDHQVVDPKMPENVPYNPPVCPSDLVPVVGDLGGPVDEIL
jgi:RHS repeat-associated protein